MKPNCSVPRHRLAQRSSTAVQRDRSSGESPRRASKTRRAARMGRNRARDGGPSTGSPPPRPPSSAASAGRGLPPPSPGQSGNVRVHRRSFRPRIATDEAPRAPQACLAACGLRLAMGPDLGRRAVPCDAGHMGRKCRRRRRVCSSSQLRCPARDSLRAVASESGAHSMQAPGPAARAQVTVGRPMQAAFTSCCQFVFA
jgi:hypothetical protein